MSTLTLRYPTATYPSSGSPGASFWSILETWGRRAHQRRQLAQLSERQLDDIGISREQAQQEAAKPFWRA